MNNDQPQSNKIAVVIDMPRASIFAIASILCEAIIIIMLKYVTTYSDISWFHPSIWLIILAGLLLMSRVVLWNKSLNHAPLSYVYTHTALGPVVLIVLSVVLLKESINIYTVIGALIITAGIYLRLSQRQVNDD